jgi:hypothetical protein
MCQGLSGNYHIRSLCFFLVKPFGFITVADRKGRRFDKCPGQIFIAILSIIFAFLLA